MISRIQETGPGGSAYSADYRRESANGGRQPGSTKEAGRKVRRPAEQQLERIEESRQGRGGRWR